MSYQSTANLEEGTLRFVLKSGTKDIHDVADKSMQKFLFESKDTTVPAYRHFLLQIYKLYSVLEAELARHKDHPIVGSVHFPDELNRTRLLEEDLDYFYEGPEWRKTLAENLTDGMKAYVARIAEVSKTKPELLVTHSYTRYLGDMSGGQILKKLLIKKYKLKQDDGTRFYDFSNVESIAKFKELYCARMNAAVTDPEALAEHLEEAKLIFQFNIDVFNQVGELFKGSGEMNLPNAVLDALPWDSFSFQLGTSAVVFSAITVMFCPWARGLLFSK